MSPALSTLLLLLLTLPAALSRTTTKEPENEFIVPPPYDPTNDFPEDNPVYTAGSRITIKWRTTYDSFKLFSMQGSETVSWSEDLKLESNATHSPHATSYSWEVWTNIEDPPYLPLYMVVYNSANDEMFRSRSFNITNGRAPDGIAYTDTERDPSVRTFTTAVVGGSTAAVGGAEPTSTPVDADEGGGGGDKDRALKLGLGIGLGVGLGIPLIAMVVLFSCGFMICRAVALDYNPNEGGDGNCRDGDMESVGDRDGGRSRGSTTGSNIIGGIGEDGEKKV
ncbi:hypothetical protein TWF481_008150 [Arthrobotrys musiformis]|uniref:Mid2 domain-containing protein n=1 Tax=Arthrobotrys musiformis TaxID=47236 RepID=A0AAV9W686_9PEZI